MRFDLLTRTIVVSALASALVVTVIVATRHTRSVESFRRQRLRGHEPDRR